MIQITPHMRIMLAVEAADFRKGIDGLAGICKRALRADPFSGTLFIFRNRKGTSIKMLLYDGQGFWIFQKRLSSGRFAWWPSTGDQKVISLAVHELQLLLWNGNPAASMVGEMWKKVEPYSNISGHIIQYTIELSEDTTRRVICVTAEGISPKKNLAGSGSS
jgi:transposase